MISKWDAQEALRLIEAERVTLFSSVPALVKDLLTQPNLADFDISSLHRVSSGGAAMPSDLPSIIEAKIDKAYASGGYGLTETLAVGSQAAGAVFDAKPDAAGVQSPIMDIRCTAPDGKVLPLGEAGEIEMRGVACTLGYWNKPEANEAVFTDDGWMKRAMWVMSLMMATSTLLVELKISSFVAAKISIQVTRSRPAIK